MYLLEETTLSSESWSCFPGNRSAKRCTGQITKTILPFVFSSDLKGRLFTDRCIRMGSQNSISWLQELGHFKSWNHWAEGMQVSVVYSSTNAVIFKTWIRRQRTAVHAHASGQREPLSIRFGSSVVWLRSMHVVEHNHLISVYLLKCLALAEEQDFLRNASS